MEAYLAILLVTIPLIISPSLSLNLDTDFTTSLQLSLDRSVKAKQNAYALGPKALTPIQKAAWEDCLDLYSSTRNALNKTLLFSKKSSKEDKQTWLSGALSFLEACKDGFIEVGDSTNILSPMFNNTLYGSICNLLHLNKDHKENNDTHSKGKYPPWVSRHDRKLLQVTPQPNVVVAKDGSGNYRTIKDAIAATSKLGGKTRFVIFIKAGIYAEYIDIATPNVMLLGAGRGLTIITGSKSVGGGGSTTFRSATVGVTPKGTGFFARGLTFRNTAGAANHQAVALRTAADHTIVYQCSIEGYQDTLYALANRQFYCDTNIYGSVDFIFGNAAAVFQNCNIYARNSPGGTNTVTAQSRTDPNQNTGYSFQNCVVTASPDRTPVQKPVKTFLGRPWKAYSRVVFMQTYLDSLINPLGWYFWIGNEFLNTLYYGEYANTGPGSSTANRVKWKGYHVITDPNVASGFTVTGLIGAGWLQGMNVPFKAGF